MRESGPLSDASASAERPVRIADQDNPPDSTPWAELVLPGGLPEQFVWSAEASLTDRDPAAADSPPPRRRGRLARCGLALLSAVHWLFGLASLIVGLAVVAAIPVLQFASLGYFLEVSRRIALTGKVRDAFPGVRKAAALGGLAAGVWLVEFPVAVISDLWYSAHLIDASSGVALAWRRGLLLATALMLGHIFTCCFAGARLRFFLWPVLWPWFTLRSIVFGYPLEEWFPAVRLWRGLRGGHWYAAARDAVWDFVTSLRLPYLFWLGLRGFLGGLAWLAAPVLLLMAGASEQPGAAVVTGLLGAVSLMVVAQYLPTLMTHFAVRNDLRAFLAVGEVRRRFRRTPLTFVFTVAVVLAFAVPLYLLKVPFIPQQIRWLPSLLFVAFTFPTRILQGAAYCRGGNPQRRSWWITRQFARLAVLPVAAFYVLIVFLSQYVAYFGGVSMFGQHAFLLPAPVFGY